MKLPPITSGLAKSAMLSMKPIRKALARPGRISGQVTVRKVYHELARSVCDAELRCDRQRAFVVRFLFENTSDAGDLRAGFTVGGAECERHDARSAGWPVGPRLAT